MSGIQDSLLPIFIEETEEGLNLVQRLIDAHGDGTLGAEVLEEARRSAHTIKGTAGLVKRMRSSGLAKELEAFLDSFDHARPQLSDDDIEQVRQWHQALVALLERAKNGEDEVDEQDQATGGVADDPMLEQGGSDLINDFALPFMMKLHQATDDVQQAVKPVCCRFFLSGRQYYLPIECVVEISESAQITYLPYGPNYIPGLINLRGNVIPVIDLAALENRKMAWPNNIYLVIAALGNDQMAFVSDTMPNLSLKAAGHKIDVETFLEQNRVKAS